MYIPNQFKVHDAEEIREFIQQNSFATLITTKKGTPIATHLPMQLVKEEDHYYITGHMAYGNPQWRTFVDSADTLVIFQGPHAYISPSWYEQENVPTWNYQAVHVYGKATIVSEEELIKDLALLLEKYEGNRKNPVLWDTLSPSLLEKELTGIVGLKIQVDEMQAAYKMSQNRNATDYQSIVDHLQHEEGPTAKQMAAQMDKRANDQ
ncbi:FMN-binding negative transcriptional regulator [Sporosarcina sp. PTS2304]|uniref:FMN-binding negative transcriptional regulator n=1 Tax=Sporosarcina sp. PTS2304 TaxID=2283194 RepID=UPI000E0D741B|nr:FMN-binding negative transcriptional regulator [Sporosarcina sp. PTS2304]AXI00919.1 FMN-binding negative transcriptional regulator [Sporosarcina sp. PTS2304]